MRLKIIGIFLLFTTSTYPITMTMTSESATWDKKKGVLLLSGNVVLTRGFITLKAPIVKVKGEIENPDKIIASSNVIVFDKERNATITAGTIEVFLKEKRASARGGVRILYKNRIILGNSGTYEGRKNIAELQGSCTMTEEARCISSEAMRYFIDEECIEFEGNVKGNLIIK